MSIDEQLTELEEKLKLQDNKLTDLKANVKWLYKYGGSGTGSGGGSGSTSTKTPALVYSSSTGNISAELGSTTSNTRIVTEGSLNLSFFLRYLNTEHTYKVSYSSNDGISWTTITISDANDFTLPLNITGNINIRVRLQDITDNSNGPAVLALSFITTPVTITTYLVGENAGGSQTVAGEIFMLNYTKIWAVMDVVPHVAGSFKASSDSLKDTFSLDEMEVDKTYTSKQLLYDTDFLSETSNVGAYSLKYSTEFKSDLSGVLTDELEETFTLIPNSTYAVVTAEGGTIYTSKPNSNYYEFSAGAIAFTGKIYKGAADGESFSTVTAKVYNTLGENLYTFPVNTPVAERANFLTGTNGTFYFSNELIKNNTSNWFEIRITIAQNLNDPPQVQSYYLFVKENGNVLNWYPGAIAGEWYFNKESYSSEMFPQNTAEISCYLGVDPVSYSWENNLNLIAPESLIAIAFKLEEGNDEVKLATLTTTADTEINIYQNKIDLGSNRTVDIYLPMDNTYHLLLIYGRIVKVSGNTLYYEWVAYIDGVIEGALSSFTDSSFRVNKITLNPEKEGVFSTNHFNYTVFECAIYKRWDAGYLGMNDSNITEYYYKYLCITNTYEEGPYATVIKDFNKIKYTYDSSTHRQEQFTKLSATEVTTLQSSGGLPVLVFQVKLEALGLILTQMESTYDEEYDPGTIQLENIQYYEAGNKEAKKCTSALESEYYYTIKIQGSSTKGFKFKNWELGIVGSLASETNPIFSLDYGEEGGFFPEQSFTLKADIVDSSHCVNTTVGDFVNDNCTPFNPGYLNCLSGKPLLILVEHISEEVADSEYYLLGIYNYNLGRNSKYNLNYAERPILDSGAKGFIVAGTSSTQTKATYASAEIANNSCFWDFSQYDSSILFENLYEVTDGINPPDNLTDTYYMWGDLVYTPGVFPIDKELLKCVKGVSRAGGFLFLWLGKDFSDDAYFTELNEASSSKAWKEINNVPNSKHKYIRKVAYNKTSASYYYKFECEKDEEGKDKEEDAYIAQDLIDCIYGRTDEEGNVTLLPYINYNSVMEYYVIMQAFGLVDSPMKNLNLKTWNYSKDKGSTFYAAFYDMDTGFGGDNAGSITITPFAFSDYWETDETGLVTRHLDYWPESDEEVGFDVPSSFLFAIGKYAAYYQQAHLEIGDTLLSPMEFWAKLRQPEGSLQNADYFVNNYMNKKFTNTHPMIWNMNYRSKYLIQGEGESEGAYDNTQFGKFHGRRLNRTKAWLNNRLHMLDAYFNVNNLAYTAENDSKISLKLDNPDTAVSNLQNNSDVVILQNIFASSGNSGIKTNSSVSCTVKALNYSPFIATSTSTTGAMRLFNSNKEYDISIAVTGNQNIFPYGSSRWTYINSVNSFVLNNQIFYMKNDYMTNLLCDKTYTTAFSPTSWLLHTPKMQNVQITGSSFKGPLQIYPGTALTSLDLSNTAIRFETNASGDYNVCPNLKTLKLNNFKGSVTLNNCNMLESIEMTGATLTSLEINPYQGDCAFTNTSIESINIVSTSENATFSLTNDNAVKHITLSGFKTVKINGCNALQDVNLMGDLPTTLCVDSCCRAGVSFPNLTKDTVVDFSGVKTLSLNTTLLDTSKITTIKADDKLTSIDAQCSLGSQFTSDVTFDLTACKGLQTANFWRSYASGAKFGTISIDESTTRFRNSNLKSITGTLIINHNKGYSFYDCPSLTTLGNVVFADGVTNAERTFEYCKSLKNISSLTIEGELTNIERMCEGVAFTSSTLFANALKGSTNSVTNMHGCFQGSSITDYSAFLALNWTGVKTKDSITGACNSNVSALSTPITKEHLTFPEASEVDPLCIFLPTATGSASYRGTTTITFNIDSLGGTNTTSLDFSYITVNDIASTDFLTNAKSCTEVSNLEFVTGTVLDFKDNGHIKSFNNCIQKKVNNENTVTTDSTGNFFKIFTSITSSLNSLSITGDLDIAEFVDYSQLKTSTKLFSEDFNIPKVITKDNFVTLVNTIFDSTGTNKLTSVQGVFKNCTITCDESCLETGTLEVPIPSNSKVTNISNLFYNCHAFYTNDDDSTVYRIYLKFTSDGKEGFSNLTNLRNCNSAWRDCYLNKLTDTWFANTEKALTDCSYAFKFAQFNLRYSDDSSSKTAYAVEADIYVGNQTDTEESSRTAKTLNSTIAKNFYGENNIGHYIIPSKFFYYENSESKKVNKVSAQFNGTEMFMGSSLYGMLPENLFATNSKPSTNCSSMFKFCTLIPYYVGSKYQTLIPSTWSYSLGSNDSKEIFQYTTFKVNIYCIVPNGTEGVPYLTGDMGDTLAGAVIVPTIHQSRKTAVSWSELWGLLSEDSENYIIPTFTSEPSSDDMIIIGTIDFIYQYNLYSLDLTSNDYGDLLPTALGIPDDYINKSGYDTLDFRLHYRSTAWDVLPDYTGYSTHGYLLQWAYNYQPATYDKTEYSDELYKIHIGTQYNGGDTLLFVDDSNTDGLTTSSTKLDTTGLINDKVALLLYGPIFNKDVKITANIKDNDMCSKLMSFNFGMGFNLPATQFGITTDSSVAGCRFYHTSDTSTELKVYDLSRNLIFPAASEVTVISSIIKGLKMTTTNASKITYTYLRYYSSRDSNISGKYIVRY